MEILFIISYVLITFAFLRIKKTNKKLNILLWIFISIILYMGYNSLLVYLLSCMGVHTTLLIRAIINIVLSLVGIFLFKERQKYYFDKLDMGVIIIIFYVSSILFLYRFGFNFNISFEMDDASIHFAASKYFALNNTVSGEYNNIIVSIPSNDMFLSYVNAGTLMQLLLPLTKTIGIYKGFILFEMLSFFLSGVLLYFIVRKNKISGKDYIFTLLLLLLYVLGYPLTNLLYGFHYWGVVILLISAIMLVIKEMTDNDMYKSKTIIFILFVLLSGIFFTYYLYVPVVYMAVGLYFIYLWKYRKKITFKELCIYAVIILIIPFIWGMIYHNILADYFLKSGGTSMSITGANYNNLLGNFIFMLPIVIYELIKDFKNHKITIMMFMTILNMLYMIVLFILCAKGIMSNYYYSKIYNLSWLMLYIYLIQAVYENKELLFRMYITLYIVIALLAFVRIEEYVNIKYNISGNTVIAELGDVYDNNMKIIREKKYLIDKNTYELLLNVRDNYDMYKNARGEVHFETTYFKRIWIAQILDIVPCNHYVKNGDEKAGFWVNVLKVNDIRAIDDDLDYFVLIPDDKNKKFINVNDYEIVYQNDAGYILKK